MNRTIVPVVIAGLVWTLSVASNPVAAASQIPCASLTTLHLPETTITSAQEVTSGFFIPPGSTTPIGGLPAFCRVVGVIAPQINFEAWLPLANWNGRYFVAGNGGFAGSISYTYVGPAAPGMSDALRRGYATAGSDTGHVGGDASWALGHPELVADFGYRAVHVTAVIGKKIVRAFYGKHADHSYFASCSKGGQQALMEAQRYEEDFDGIGAGAPANFWTHLLAAAVGGTQARLKDPESYFPASKLPLITNAVNALCDATDGVVDGVVDDPRKCDFKPASLQCKAGQDPSTCFTAKQVVALEQLYAGPHNPRTGERIFPGLLPGAETGPNGWASWITGAVPGGSLSDFFGSQFFKFMVFEDPAYNVLTFNFDSDLAFTDAKLAATLNSTDPDLHAFKNRGGKMIMWHGWNDPAIPAENSVNYYKSVVSLSKGRHERGDEATEEVQDFLRLFMMPGVQHCGGGPGPGIIDTLTLLENWVEQGVAPKRIIAARVNATGAVDRTRPLCVYPKVAVYKGEGSTDDAANFACRNPQHHDDRDGHDRDDD